MTALARLRAARAEWHAACAAKRILRATFQAASRVECDAWAAMRRARREARNERDRHGEGAT